MEAITRTATGLSAAVAIAYKAVISLGYTRQQLVDEHLGVNHNTLRRIHDGEARKPMTDRFYLQLFLKLLETEYQRRIANGADGAGEILRIMRIILLTEHDIAID